MILRVRYEFEIFDHLTPKTVIVCAHGNGVRRWDGEKFFYAVAEHFADSAVLLVDQNQPDGDGVRLNPLSILKSRVEELVPRSQATLSRDSDSCNGPLYGLRCGIPARHR